jgi:pimeloyl-ACP methyl ester carboxylesterase
VRSSLSVRSQFPDETISDAVWVSEGLRSDLAAERLIVLIHGYNNSVPKAQGSYAAFQNRLRKAIGAWGYVGLGKVWEFHWPGDHPNQVVSTASYAARIGDARDAGRLLGIFLAQLRPSQAVWLIAHSLGCRVALHTVKTVRDLGAAYAGARIEQVFLLAAAVPVRYCTAGRAYPSPVAPGSAEHAFYSSNDEALGWKFNQGQAMYGEPGDAVGLSGRPDGRWEPPPFRTGLKHGEYWRSELVAEELCRRTGQLPDSSSRERPLSASPAADDVRELDERSADTRPLPDRSSEIGM